MRIETVQAISQALDAVAAFLRMQPPMPSEVEAARDRAVSAIAAAREAIVVDPLDTAARLAEIRAQVDAMKPATGGAA